MLIGIWASLLLGLNHGLANDAAFPGVCNDNEMDKEHLPGEKLVASPVLKELQKDWSPANQLSCNVAES